MENIETLLAAVAQTQGFDDDPVDVFVSAAEGADYRRGIGEAAANAQTPEAVPALPVVCAIPATGRVIAAAGEKRKRGRPPKGGQVVAAGPPPQKRKKKKDEEDVCFICFDGGELVMCDRKGCPKAYHAVCVKRDPAFFRSKAKWNCGWHICSVCQKASHYFCYTCTYSLCKACTKNADYVCVRENKGFCSTCMKPIMMIENQDQANSESVQVDFNDQTSFEYLFKVYWDLLKTKLSLTLDELTQAKSNWKGVPATVVRKPESSNVPLAAVDGKISVTSSKTENLELNAPRAETSSLPNHGLRTVLSSIDSIDNCVNKLNFNNSKGKPCCNHDAVKLNADKVSDETGIKRDKYKPSVVGDDDKPLVCKTTDSKESGKTGEAGIKRDQYRPSTVGDNDKLFVHKTESKEPNKTGSENNTEWASKDLLEFVAFMRNGDTSIMAPFDVQALLLDYIKRNKLRDPRQKSQIICDQRLKKLFVKPRLGHIEMLKLLEFHFPTKEDSQNNSLIPAACVTINVEADANIISFPTSINSRKRKMRRRNEEKIPQNNLHEYAAIDVHNINLIYLRRNLMENLLDDQENFDNKVIGSIVRIRTSSNDQRQDVYRLVRVVGTIKVAESYKIGERTTNYMLEVLNLYKKEVVSIDAISNQEFTEEECRRLRQSIRCGLVKQLTVGEVQKIALVLQQVRIKDLLEAEILRLNHLRDRASEKGRKKEHREYVDKLQLLKTPEEQQRRIAQVPEIHADPKMSPNYESEEDEDHAKSGDNNKKVACSRPNYSGFPHNRRNPVLPNKNGKIEQHMHSQNRRGKTDAKISPSLDKPVNQVIAATSEVCVKNTLSVQRSALETSTPTATASLENLPSNNIETEKLWHYRDPSGKIQGPFSMMNLRKWNTTGLFPLDMRIWTNHEQYDSILLTEALNGRLHGASESFHKQSSVSESSLGQSVISESSRKQSSVSDSSLKQSSVSLESQTAGGTGKSEGIIENIGCDKQTEAAQSSDVSVVTYNNTGPVRETGTESSTWPQCWDLLNDNISSGDDAIELDVVPLPNHGQAVISLPVQGQKSDEFNHGSQDLERNSSGPTQEPVSTEDELQNQCIENQAAQPSEEICPSLDIAPVLNSPDLEKQVVGIDLEEIHSPTPTVATDHGCVPDILELMSPTSRSNNMEVTEAQKSEILNFSEPDSASQWIGDSTIAADLEKQVVGIDLEEIHSPTPTEATDHGCVPDILELMSPTSRSNNMEVTEAQKSEILNFSEPDSASKWIGDSTIAADGVQFPGPGIENEWCGYSPTPGKQSMPEWDSSFPSPSSLKPRVTNEYTATSISEGHQMPRDGHQFSGAPPVEDITDTTSWLALLHGNGAIEDYSDLFAEVDARESQGAPIPMPMPMLMHSPNSALKSVQQFLETDDCYSSIEDFDPTPNPQIHDASGSTGDMQMTATSSCNPIETLDGFDSFRKSSVNSSASSEAETIAQVFSGDAGSEFHPPNYPNQDMVGLGHMPITPSSGSESIDPGWGTVQGNINLVTVQGNVNLVLGGPTQGMANLGWGTNPGTAWVNPSLNHSPRNMSLPWDGQRKYGGERFTSPRASYQGNEPGFGRGRPPRGRQPFNSGYQRSLPRVQRVCKFFESGHCKKGAFCDYLHP